MDQEAKASNHSSDMDQQEEFSNDIVQEEEFSNQSSDINQEADVTSYKTKTHKIIAHSAEIQVVYTDDNYKAADIVDMYEQWLSKDEYKFVGLDFEYCDP
jgi:cupin superfamily acireductone dioxygenase involved in methionine salvage